MFICCLYDVWYGLIDLFFFKQKTAYEMRISDWSSDVCSSDLKQLEEARAILESAQERLDEAKQLLEAIRDDEQDYYDNMPESFQGGDKGCAAEAAIDQLSTAIDDIDLVDFDTFFNAKNGSASCRERVCQYV